MTSEAFISGVHESEKEDQKVSIHAGGPSTCRGGFERRLAVDVCERPA